MAANYEEIASGSESMEQQQGWASASRATEPGVSPGSPGAVTAKSVADQLSALLITADESAKRIVEEAEARARDHMAEIDRRARRVEAEAARLASWSRQTEQLIQTLWSAFSEFRKDVESIPRQVNEALAPLASHVTVIVRQIDQLTSALESQVPARPPASATPSSSSDDAAYPGGIPFEVAPGDGSMQASRVTSWDDYASGNPTGTP